MTTQQTFVGLQGMSWKRLQRAFSVTIFHYPRRLEDISQDVLKTSSRCFGDKQNVYWGHLYLTNLNLYLSNLYLTNLYLTNLLRIQNALIRNQKISKLVLISNSRSNSILRIKVSDKPANIFGLQDVLKTSSRYVLKTS